MLQAQVSVYPIQNYAFGVKPEIETDAEFTLKEYQWMGMRTTVLGVLLSHEHNHPHLLMFSSSDQMFLL